MSENEPLAPRIITHPGTQDVRGTGFPVPADLLTWLGGVADLHVMTLRPGHVRGNHHHVDKDELLVVLHRDAWSLHWSGPSGEATGSRTFAGVGGVSIAVPRLLAHAIRNDGTSDLFIVGASPVTFDPANPDAVRVDVVPR